MAKEIVQADLARIRALLDEVLGHSDYSDVQRMGGLTNRTYCVSFADGSRIMVRIPGEGTEELVKKIAEILGRESRRVTLLLPYDKVGIADTLRREAAVLSLEYGETGVTVEAVVKPELWGLVREYVQNDSPKE